MSGLKTDRYKRVINQIESLISPDQNEITRMTTINAILFHKMKDFFWVGFYLLDHGVLSAGPYQGPLACPELEKNKGVCWKSIMEQDVIIVPDVHLFPGHIACNPKSKSEIAIPLFNKEGSVKGVLDIDSREIAFFNSTDAEYLKKIASLVYK